MREAMTIGELARTCGVGVETVRYYQRRGLLDTPRRPPGGVRRYGLGTSARLGFIKRAQEVGFTLDEIAQLLRLERVPGCRDARSLAEAKLAAVDARIADLERIRGALRHLVEQCEAGNRRACPIIASFSAG